MRPISLDALYCDKDRDLVADPPKDPKKLSAFLRKRVAWVGEWPDPPGRGTYAE